MKSLSTEQNEIIESQLVPLCVAACAGSGKTRTAVYRVARMRALMGVRRGRIALLSFSNVAVDTFRRDHQTLAQIDPARFQIGGIDIDTVDSFITKNILRPHAHRTMNTVRTAFLVNGREQFLNSFTFKNANADIKFPHRTTDLRFGFKDGSPNFFSQYQDTVTPVDFGVAKALIERLGRTGAYTHDLGRYWAYRALTEQPLILRALARRFSHIVVDEAQDIGPGHEVILELLAAAGTQLSLIGDINQGIYEFAGADGRYLKGYESHAGVSVFPLTRNFRSVPDIVKVANALSTRSDTADRLAPSVPNGAYFISYIDTNQKQLIDVFRKAIVSAGLRYKDSVIVCRSRDWADGWGGSEKLSGQGSTKSFAAATILRDKNFDYYGAFEIVWGTLVGLLDNVENDLVTKLLRPSISPELRRLRRSVWAFVRDPKVGLPSSTLIADTEWHPLLVERVKALLASLNVDFNLSTGENIGQKISKKNLNHHSLLSQEVVESPPEPSIRVRTVHQVKGESIDAVMYVASKAHVQELLNGTSSEVGRIGYVAVTRARNIFLLAVPAKCFHEFKGDLITRGFREAAF